MFLFSLDKELVRLVEEKKLKEQLEASKNETTTNEIKVKPIIETIPPETSKPRPPSSSLVKMNNHDKAEDLLR